MAIFKAYDIRGIYGEEINPPLAKAIGRAFARYCPVDSLMIGYDARLHSKTLYEALIEGLTEEGKKVTGIGLVSTPQLHYCQMKKQFPAAIMVTASHNPPQYHGFKFFDNSGGSISYEKGLKEVEVLLKRLSGTTPPPAPTGLTAKHRALFHEEDRLSDYIDFLIPINTCQKYALKIVVDISNGSAGRVFKELGSRLGIPMQLLNEQPDGRFPNHHPNPLEEASRKQIAQKVLETKADLGVILDGDGDRVIFIDEQGEPVESYFMACLISEELLNKNPGGTIVYDLISSRVLPEYVARLGGKPAISKVGYTFLYDTMVKTGALFGNETSGHVYFKVSPTYYTESAAYALLMVLNILESKGQPLSKLLKPLKEQYAQAPEINLQVKNKDKIIQKIEQVYSSKAKGDHKVTIDKLDGLTITMPNFWFNVRGSNTEPLLRLRLEASTADVAKEQAEEIQELIRETDS
jgi:phosphomannomutase